MEKDLRTPVGGDNKRPAQNVQIASGTVELKQPSNGAAGREGASPEDAVNRLKRGPSNDGDAGRPGELIELWRVSRSEFDALLTEARAVQERSSKLTQSLMGELQTTIWRMIETALSGFQKEIHERVALEASMMLENLDVEAGARLAARVDQALARAKDHQRLVERNLAGIAAENQKAASTISARAAEEMQSRAATLRAEIESEVQAKVNEIKHNAHEAAGSAREITQTVIDELEKRTGQALVGFESRMAQMEREAVARVQERIDALANSTMSTIAKQVQDAADRHISKFFIQAFRSRLDQLTDVLKRSDTVESEYEGGEPRVRVGESDRATSAIPNLMAGDTGQVIAPLEPESAETETTPHNPIPTRSDPIDRSYASRESSFRQDFELRYGAERSYEEYAPAYRFGYGLAAEPRYQGKDWLSIEPEVKRLWEIRSDGKWDKFKGSIQYAWLSALAAERN